MGIAIIVHKECTLTFLLQTTVDSCDGKVGSFRVITNNKGHEGAETLQTSSIG